MCLESENYCDKSRTGGAIERRSEKSHVENEREANEEKIEKKGKKYRETGKRIYERKMPPRIRDYSPGKRRGWKSPIRVIHQTQPFFFSPSEAYVPLLTRKLLGMKLKMEGYIYMYAYANMRIKFYTFV